mmetsp:Transcript_95444/g.270197  ORF Transcript_95444/g.270197 Transcript_95444/m.270197 type:complete len:190 (+) Transcript_95444:43-612(+)
MFQSWPSALTGLAELLCSLGMSPKKEANICFLGLDKSGKTTLWKALQDSGTCPCACLPGLCQKTKKLIIQGTHLHTHDVGLLVAVDGIVFLVDATDRPRFREAREQLRLLLEEPALEHVPFAVLGNKNDSPVAASEDELKDSLGLDQYMTANKAADQSEFCMQPLELFMVSAAKHKGYMEAFEWMARLI